MGIPIQKKVVNDVSFKDRAQRFLPALLKNPRRLAGFLLEYGIITAACMIAHNLIGSVLDPRLMAVVLLIVSAAFLLGRRHVELEKLK